MKRPFLPSLILFALLLGAGVSGQPAVTNAPGLVPPVPLVPSPVRVLRELLSQPTAKREQLLGMYPEGLRRPLEAKVKEYLALSSELRELRLQATDLRHYLLQLLPLDRPSQLASLNQVPESIRKLISARLDWWHLLPPGMHQEFLQNEQAVSYLTQMGITSEEQRQAVLNITPPGARAQMEQRIADWLAQPEERRRRVFAQFNQMFTLTPAERQQALGRLPEDERQTMSQALARFGTLPPEKRLVCLRSFERFSRMSLLERHEFLQKAQAWDRMSSEERQHWRELVSAVRELPPLPPGLEPRTLLPTPTPGTSGG